MSQSNRIKEAKERFYSIYSGLLSQPELTKFMKVFDLLALVFEGEEKKEVCDIVRCPSCKAPFEICLPNKPIPKPEPKAEPIAVGDEVLLYDMALKVTNIFTCARVVDAQNREISPQIAIKNLKLIGKRGESR